MTFDVMKTCADCGAHAHLGRCIDVALQRAEKAEVRVAEMQASRDLALDNASLSAMRAERLEARVEELELVLTKLADAGADGHAEQGCIFCLTGPNPEEPKYTLEMAIAGSHLPTCWIGNVLAKRPTHSVCPTQGEKNG